MLTFDSTSSHYIYLPEGPCALRPRETTLLFLTIFVFNCLLSVNLLRERPYSTRLRETTLLFLTICAFNCLLSVNLLRERYSARPRENFKYKFTNMQLCRQSKTIVVFHFLFQLFAFCKFIVRKAIFS